MKVGTYRSGVMKSRRATLPFRHYPAGVFALDFWPRLHHIGLRTHARFAADWQVGKHYFRAQDAMRISIPARPASANTPGLHARGRAYRAPPTITHAWGSFKNQNLR